METFTDKDRIYSTLYTDFENQDCLQASYTIAGQEGKQIQIDELSCQMIVMKAGVTGTVIVVAEVDGVDYQLSTWDVIKTVYTLMNSTPVFLADTGKSVTLKWYLKTSDAAQRAKMKLLSYSYTLVNVPVVEDNTPCLVVIECESESSANGLIEALSGSGYLDKGIGIYIQK